MGSSTNKPPAVEDQAVTPRADQDPAAGSVDVDDPAPAEIGPGDLVVLGATVDVQRGNKTVREWTNDPDVLAEHGIVPQFAIVVEPGKSVIHLGEPVPYELPVTRA